MHTHTHAHTHVQATYRCAVASAIFESGSSKSALTMSVLLYILANSPPTKLHTCARPPPNSAIMQCNAIQRTRNTQVMRNEADRRYTEKDQRQGSIDRQ